MICSLIIKYNLDKVTVETDQMVIDYETVTKTLKKSKVYANVFET